MIKKNPKPTFRGRNIYIYENEPLMTVKVTQLECTHCGYRWFPSVSNEGKIQVPKVCSNCSSPNYDKPRIWIHKRERVT